MRATSLASVRAVDVVGGLVLAACVTGFFWLTFVQNDQTKNHIDDLRHVIDVARRDIRALERARAGQNRKLAEHQATLEQTGRLPERAPTEEYFKTLSKLAQQNSLRVIRLNPLGARIYPGLLEERYVYEVMGSMPNVVRFLEAIEQADYWADVSYLHLSRGIGDENSAIGKRRAELTLSLFSAPLHSAEPGGEGT